MRSSDCWPVVLLSVSLSIAAFRVDAQELEEPDQMDRALAFAECMRENGVPEFPDPDPAGGGTRFIAGGRSGEDRERFRAAREACRELAPFGRTMGEIDPERIEHLMALAECMRENGVPEWPDPGPEGGFSLGGTDIGLRDGRVRSAMETCREAQRESRAGAIGIRVTR